MKLNEYLERENEKASDFAKRIGLSRSFLSLIISGKRNPSPRVALKIEGATRKKVKAVELIFPN
jgi:transcriptional regulator with XRE-family HTH domain